MGLTASSLNCAFPRLVAETADGQKPELPVLSGHDRAMQNRCLARVLPDGRRGPCAQGPLLEKRSCVKLF